MKESPKQGFFVKDLSEHVVKNVHQIHQLLSSGMKNRAVGVT